MMESVCAFCNLRARLFLCFRNVFEKNKFFYFFIYFFFPFGKAMNFIEK